MSISVKSSTAASEPKTAIAELSLGQIKHQQAETPDETCCSTLSSCQEEGSCADFGSYLSGVLTCVLDCIYKLLAALGLYATDDDKVRQFIAWAKSPDSKDFNFIATEAAKDPVQWKAEFNKLPLTAQRYVMRGLYNFDTKAGFISVQQRLAKEPFEDESDHMWYRIEDGLADLVYAQPGSEVVILELERWLLKDQDERDVKNPLQPNERVRRFCDLWKPAQGEARPTPEFCTWSECYMTLPDLAKDCARRAYQKFYPNDKIPALPEFPNKEDVAAYNQYLGVAVILDSLIIKEEREPQVMLALNFWRGPVNKKEA